MGRRHRWYDFMYERNVPSRLGTAFGGKCDKLAGKSYNLGFRNLNKRRLDLSCIYYTKEDC